MTRRAAATPLHLARLLFPGVFGSLSGNAAFPGVLSATFLPPLVFTYRALLTKVEARSNAFELVLRLVALCEAVSL
jgi:hypothetical protein